MTIHNFYNIFSFTLILGVGSILKVPRFFFNPPTQSKERQTWQLRYNLLGTQEVCKKCANNRYNTVSTALLLLDGVVTNFYQNAKWYKLKTYLAHQ